MRKRTAHFPGKNEKYLLSSKERTDPAVVFTDLFDAYDLDALRRRLRDVVESALFDRDCDAQSYFFLFKHLEKLVEAAHAVVEESVKDPAGTDEDILLADDQVDEKFYKPPRFEEIASLRPLEALEKTFAACNVNDVIDEVEKWKRSVMTGALSMYDETSLREHFWTFCDQLMCLVESAHIYSREQRPSEKKEMENFFTCFTLTYAQRELWDCFEAVISDQRQDACIDKTTVTLTYRCLLSVIVATFYLLESSEPAESVSMFEKKVV